MAAFRGSGLTVLIAVWATGCIDFTLPNELSLFPSDTSFILTGQAQSNDNGCFVWLADIGVTFVLMQDRLIADSDFDQVVTPGTRSRLELEVRTDLEGLGQPCVPDAIVAQVTRVREIVGQ